MQCRIELTSILAKNIPSGNFEFTEGTVAETLTAFGIDIDEVGFVSANGVICSKDSQTVDGTTYKVYPTIVAG
jgi:hypothetical protein